MLHEHWNMGQCWQNYLVETVPLTLDEVRGGIQEAFYPRFQWLERFYSYPRHLVPVTYNDTTEQLYCIASGMDGLTHFWIVQGDARIPCHTAAIGLVQPYVPPNYVSPAFNSI